MDDIVDGILIQIGGGYIGLCSVSLFKEKGLWASPSKIASWVQIIFTRSVLLFNIKFLFLRIFMIY